jgi:ornithine cyclodeaminase/alanine dehydrogenase-like protein (mu-crystallin family)
MTLLLRESDVRQIMAMDDALDWVESACRAESAAHARNLARQRIRLPRGTLHMMAGAELDLGVVGVKSYTSFRDGNRFLVLLYSAESGALLALVEADYLGMMRTGAATGVATKYMARVNAGVVGLIGSGWQARGQLHAIAGVRKLSEVRVFSRTPQKREKFAAEQSAELGLNVVAVDTADAAVRGADIVATITWSRDPVFPADAVGPGTHLIGAGSNALNRAEIDERVVRNARVVVDSRAEAQIEGGDLLGPFERGWLDWEQLPRLCDVVAGVVPGRTSDEEVTLFESHGLGLHDVAVAANVYTRAVERGLGEQIALFS